MSDYGQDYETMMRAAALCRGIAGKLHCQATEQKYATRMRTFGAMADGADHCVRAIEKAISLLIKPEAKCCLCDKTENEHLNLTHIFMQGGRSQASGGTVDV